jgi:hypothetical protein
MQKFKSYRIISLIKVGNLYFDAKNLFFKTFIRI